MSDKIKDGDRVFWIGSIKSRGIGVVMKNINIIHPEHTLRVKWEDGGETNITPDGTQVTNGMTWVRKLTPLEELL